MDHNVVKLNDNLIIFLLILMTL